MTLVLLSIDIHTVVYKSYEVCTLLNTVIRDIYLQKNACHDYYQFSINDVDVLFAAAAKNL